MPTRCNRGFYCRSYCLLNTFRAPLCPSSEAQEQSGCCLWYFVLWFSSCWSGAELRVMCPVCRMLQQPLLHLVGILFPHINDDARSKSLQINLCICWFSVANWLPIIYGMNNINKNATKDSSSAVSDYVWQCRNGEATEICYMTPGLWKSCRPQRAPSWATRISMQIFKFSSSKLHLVDPAVQYLPITTINNSLLHSYSDTSRLMIGRLRAITMHRIKMGTTKTTQPKIFRKGNNRLHQINVDTICYQIIYHIQHFNYQLTHTTLKKSRVIKTF